MQGDELLRVLIELFDGEHIAGQELDSAVPQERPSIEQKQKSVGQNRPDGYCTGGGWEGASQVLVIGEEAMP